MDFIEPLRRVLVVDDLPDARATISGLFEDEGYYVQTASGKEEALKLVALDSFHVAILDIRLDENDDSNKEGIELLIEIRDRDPAIIPVILSGYIDWEIYAFAQSHNIPIVRKSNFLQIIEEVEQVFDSRVRINWELTIKDDERFIDEIPRKLRIDMPAKQVVRESEEILRKLFFDPNLQAISISPIRRGYSSMIILKVIPWYRGLGRGEVIVAKIGESKLIRGEIDRYENIKGIVGGHRIPRKLETAETRHLSGIIYTFAGLGDARDFDTFYENADSLQVNNSIINLFEETCFPSRYDSISNELQDLSLIYRKLLRLTQEKLNDAIKKMIGGRHPIILSEDNQNIILENGYRLKNPVSFINNNNLSALSYSTVIHGDLHGYNVLVDHRVGTWLIDFDDTGIGPLWHDFTSFENFLKISLFETRDWIMFLEWERLLTNNLDLENVPLPDSLKKIPNIEKLYSAIQTVRKIAINYGMSDTANAYRIGILFNALRLIGILNLPVYMRDHALITASLVAEDLSKSM